MIVSSDEMHQQFPEARFVRAIELEGADRTAVLGERLRGGTALGGDEIADGLTGEARLSHHSEQLVARAGDEELEPAVLVDRAERRDPRRAPAGLAGIIDALQDGPWKELTPNRGSVNRLWPA
jgi:hypothetical protein